MVHSGNNLSDRHNVVGERRQLVVVFIDLAGSTDLSSRIDTEDYAALILAYQEAGRRTFSDYGGRIAQYLGDGLLLYFGYPQARENDAERAVRAALDMLDAMQQPGAARDGNRLLARIGVHVGEVVVGESQQGGRDVLFGEAVNIAARIEAQARPGTVLVSEPVMSLLRQKFVAQDLGPIALKGVARPLQLHRILRPATPGIRSGDLAGSAPLLGRAAPLGQLRDLWQQATAKGPVAATVKGDPGIGKTSLLRAFRAELADTPHIWLEVQCEALSTGAPLAPFIALIRQSLGITQGMGEEEALARLRQGVLQQEDAPEEAVVIIARLLGIDTAATVTLEGESPETLRHETLLALGHWIARLAADRPVALICEDLHWSDATSLELLELLLDWPQPLALFCLVAQRPDGSAELPAKQTKVIELAALTPDEARQLAQQTAAPAELQDPVLEDILTRAGGNPLYVEELSRFAGEKRTRQRPDVGIPPTLNSLIMERLDVLSPGSKKTAQVAAVLGEDLDMSVLSMVARRNEAEIADTVGDLLQADILRPRPGTNDGYMFRHALTQEAVYATLLRAERSELHARAAACLQEDAAGGASVQPDMVAHHLQASRQFIDAAIWYRDAGLRAVKQAAVEDATVLYRRALAALEETESGRQRDEIELSVQILLENAIMGVRGFASPEIKPVLDRALELAERLGDHDETSSVLNGLAAHHLDKGDSAKGIEFANRILDMPRSGTDRIGRLRAHTSLAFLRFNLGEGAAAVEHAEEVIRLYRPEDYAKVTYGIGTDQGVLAYGVGAMAHWWCGAPDTALRRAEAGLALAESLNSALSLAAARAFLIMVLHFRGETQRAYALATETYETCTQLGIPLWGGLGQLLRAGQPVDPPQQRCREVDAALAMLAKTGSQSGSGLGFAIMAGTRLANDDANTALVILDTGLKMAGLLNQPVWNPEMMRVRAQALAALDRCEEAETQLCAALDEADNYGAVSLALRCALSLAELLVDTGRDAEVTQLVAHWVSRIEPGAATADLRRAAALISDQSKGRNFHKGTPS
ncbi:AAA family ATPase [Ruegeria sp. 2012CJ41-6]|uniref:AAA family ATPase n=1 Tax=Ruegeria spongiae TaxID=2942209 RepID=A0ABT0Q2S0_9RHOB|nr:adenylate/guanylate cyclase domain-containing protein [Ruegeria spongiae]MCL6284169.1 AAA family ATPase [Ruegeria spongiae]